MVAIASPISRGDDYAVGGGENGGAVGGAEVDALVHPVDLEDRMAAHAEAAARACVHGTGEAAGEGRKFDGAAGRDAAVVGRDLRLDRVLFGIELGDDLL